jgi:hypothetical protein
VSRKEGKKERRCQGRKEGRKDLSQCPTTSPVREIPSYPKPEGRKEGDEGKKEEGILMRKLTIPPFRPFLQERFYWMKKVNKKLPWRTAVAAALLFAVGSVSEAESMHLPLPHVLTSYTLFCSC